MYEHGIGGDKAGDRGFFVRDFIRFFAVDIILILAVKLFLGLGFFATPDAYVAALLGSKVILFAYLVWLIGDKRDAWPETGGASPGKWWAWPVCIGMYLVFLPFYQPIQEYNLRIMARLYALLGRVFVPEVQDAVVLVFDDILGKPLKLTLVLFIVVAGPILEELAFRGVGLDAYRRTRGTVWAVAWTSLLFGLYHFSLQLVIPITILGMLFAVARLVSGSLWCAAAVHCLHNFTVLAINAKQLGIIDIPWI